MLPRISIVTPSYNQAPFLGETLTSVLGQDWPDLEYIVMDGGSTDGSVDLIQAQAHKLAYWQSAPDGGQSAALNAGFARSTGDILGWVNSDDYYLPGALQRAAAVLHPSRAEILVANGIVYDMPRARTLATRVQDRSRSSTLEWFDFVLQPATFWTRAAWDLVGPLDADLHYAFDWEWFVRAKKAGVLFHIQEHMQAVARVHGSTKTETGGSRRDEEIATVYGRHIGLHAAAFYRYAAQHRKQVARLRKWLRRVGLQDHTNTALRKMWGAKIVPALTSQQTENLLDML
ncbi:MAG: glycosyltransferase family 2 protein [Candidatus Methylacidiphilales bacterium]|nr:glycosyltransferase family 2 protein [Candidatus Methylacidiphilales bacterium]